LIWGFMRIGAMPSVFDPGLGKWVPGKDCLKKMAAGACGVTGGLAVPGVTNWLVSAARDANLFS